MIVIFSPYLLALKHYLFSVISLYGVVSEINILPHMLLKDPLGVLIKVLVWQLIEGYSRKWTVI